MKISSSFDSGNGTAIKAERFDDIQIKIEKDSNSDFFQWFHFRLQGAKEEDCKIKIMNAGETSWPDGWNNYQAVASYDRMNWFRVPTSFDGKIMTIDHMPEFDSVFYAYFAPFSYEQHLNLLSYAQLSERVEMLYLGETLDGRDFNLLKIGEEASDKKKVWIIARQHPGETMAEWFMEGFIEKIIDTEDALINTLLKDSVFYVVPNMNPDGSYRGNLRVNAAGSNLNREWMEPSLEKSPEVFYTRKLMKEIGVDIFLDIHGDEELPYVFVSGCEGNPSYDELHKKKEDIFKAAFEEINPDFQDEFGYEKDKPGKADLRIAANYVGEEFKCLSYTIEMPFKDNKNLPDEDFGWSPERSSKLGESVFYPIKKVIDFIK
jgi:murein tripeptide amidase MpaA